MAVQGVGSSGTDLVQLLQAMREQYRSEASGQTDGMSFDEMDFGAMMPPEGMEGMEPSEGMEPPDGLSWPPGGMMLEMMGNLPEGVELPEYTDATVSEDGTVTEDEEVEDMPPPPPPPMGPPPGMMETEESETDETEELESLRSAILSWLFGTEETEEDETVDSTEEVDTEALLQTTSTETEETEEESETTDALKDEIIASIEEFLARLQVKYTDGESGFAKPGFPTSSTDMYSGFTRAEMRGVAG